MSKERVHIFRHGESSYRQGLVSIAEANDLTDYGVNKVSESALNLINRMSTNMSVPVVIASSPTGRTLQTARIITDLLANSNIPVREKNKSKHSGILRFYHLQDQMNYSYEAVDILVKGGEVEYEKERFFVDRDITNPTRLPIENFGTKEISAIPPCIFETFPKVFVKKIRSIESSIHAQQRMDRILQMLFEPKHRQSDRNYVLVSHDILSSHIVKFITQGKKDRLEPGEFLSLNRNGDALHTKIGELTGEFSYKNDFCNFFITHE